MKWISAFITTALLASISWAACPVASTLNSAADRRSALQDLRDAGFKYFREGQYQNAGACYREALHTGEALGINNSATANDLGDLGDVAEEMGDYTDARNYYVSALDLLRRLGESASGMAGDLYTKLGVLMQIQGLFSEAENNFKKAVGLLTQHAGIENWRTANALNRLGRVYLEMRKLPEASSLLRKARAIAEKSLSPDNPLLITFFDSEAYLLCQTGRFKEAETKWLAALKIAEHAHGGNGTEYGFLLLHLGQMYSLIGDYSAAVTILRRGAAVEERIAGSDPVDRAIVVSSLANVYIKQRRLAEAEPLMLKSREVINADCSASPMACSLIRSNLGNYYMKKGQWAMAAAEFQAALRLREDSLGDHPLVADSQISLARALRKVKRKEEAKTYEARASRILSSQNNPMYDGRNTIDVRAFQAGNH